MYGRGIIISTEHLDGVYQTFNVLKRIYIGDAFGEDFYPYLGLGPTLSIYPFFHFLGGTVFASQLSASIITLLYWFIGLYTFTKFSPINISSKNAQIIILIFLYTIFASKIDPGNSLLGARSFVVVLAAWALYFFLIKNNKPFLFGVAISIVLLWSNDYGIPTAIGMLTTAIIYHKSIFNKSLLWSIATFVLISPMLLSIVTSNNLYSFISSTLDISQDQFWYFYPYDESNKYYSFLDILTFWDHGLSFKSFVLIMAIPLMFIFIFSVIKNKSQNSLILFLFSISSFGSGLLSEIAGHKSVAYFNMFYASLFFVFIQMVYTYREILKTTLVYRYYCICVNTIRLHNYRYMLSFLIVVSIYGSIYETIKIVNEINNSTYISDLGGYVDNEDVDLISISKNISLKHTNDLLLSEYSGLPNAILNYPNKLNSDSVIHALGKETRQKYLSEMMRLDYRFATTTNPSHSDWQSWSLFQNWYFYKHVINNFMPMQSSSQLIFWKKEKNVNFISIGYKDIKCEIKMLSEFKNKLIIRPDKNMDDGLYEVNIDFKLKSTDSFVPVVGKNKLIHIETSLLDNNGIKSFTISPYKRTAQFPVYFSETSPYFIVSAFPKERSVLDIKSCNVKFITDDQLKISSIIKS